MAFFPLAFYPLTSIRPVCFHRWARASPQPLSILYNAKILLKNKMDAVVISIRDWTFHSFLAFLPPIVGPELLPPPPSSFPLTQTPHQWLDTQLRHMQCLQNNDKMSLEEGGFLFSSRYKTAHFFSLFSLLHFIQLVRQNRYPLYSFNFFPPVTPQPLSLMMRWVGKKMDVVVISIPMFVFVDSIEQTFGMHLKINYISTTCSHVQLFLSFLDSG